MERPPRYTPRRKEEKRQEFCMIEHEFESQEKNICISEEIEYEYTLALALYTLEGILNEKFYSVEDLKSFRCPIDKKEFEIICKEYEKDRL